VRAGTWLRTVLPAAVCLGVILCFYGFVAVRGGFARVPGGLESLVTPASAGLALLAWFDLRERGVETRTSIALLTFVLPPIGVWVWVSQARRVSRTSAGTARRPPRRG
jgi:hypothetical protein